MATVSFILTSFDILPYLPQCLHSLAEVARPGDEVIIIDDGSTDGSAELVSTGLAGFGFEQGVIMKPVCLGANTMGGVGIPANIGLSLATRELVFFVDGDDWIMPAGFNRARSQMAVTSADILIANYRVFDETHQKSGLPADADRWHVPGPEGGIGDSRLRAISLIGVPWRKFYRRAFVEANHLRFPEGDFFYEDNPFHWSVCLAARSIRFVDAAVCQHRVNRLGQTMAENGMALTAFFTHYKTITGMLHRRDVAYHRLAVKWLIENMAWHSSRLTAEALYPYALEAAATLAAVPSSIWTEAVARHGHLYPVWVAAERLRRGDISGQVSAWQHQKLYDRLTRIEAHLHEISASSKGALDRLRGQDAAAAFAAITSASGDKHH